MRFIELTQSKTGKPISLNVYFVGAVMTIDIIPASEAQDSSARSIVTMSFGTNYHVREMPKDVMKLVNNSSAEVRAIDTALRNGAKPKPKTELS